MNIYVVRHGQAQYNTKGISNADPSVDNPLTNTGVQQAEKLAEKLRDISLDRIYTSDFPRTKQTTEIINRYHSAPVHVSSLINELYIDIEGEPTAEWNKQRYQSDDTWNFKCNDGESLADGLSRVEEFVEYLKSTNHKNIVVVTHGFIVLALRAIMDGYPIEQKYQTSDPGAEVSHVTVYQLST